METVLWSDGLAACALGWEEWTHNGRFEPGFRLAIAQARELAEEPSADGGCENAGKVQHPPHGTGAGTGVASWVHDGAGTRRNSTSGSPWRSKPGRGSSGRVCRCLAGPLACPGRVTAAALCHPSGCGW